jgi:hypothetical protein
MKKTTRFVGLDVHADTIAVAVAEPDGTVRSLGRIPMGSALRCDRANTDPDESPRPGEDGSSGCGEVGALLPQW